MWYNYHSIVHNDIQEVCRSSSLVTALASTAIGWGFNCSMEFLPDAEHMNMVDKSAFADVLGEAAWSHTYSCSVQAHSSVYRPLCNSLNMHGQY